MSKPNILLIVADDLGYGDVGYQGGKFNTKNIDWLAEHGTVLTSFYGHPTCTPSRACFMTGRYASRYGLQEVMWPWSNYGLSLLERTLPQALKEMSYTNYIIGKWHLGYHEGYLPLDRGFDYHYGCLATTKYYVHTNYAEKLDWYRNGKLVEEEGFVTDLLVEDAVKMIQKTPEPFFMYVPFTAPHEPIAPPPECPKKANLRQSYKHYYKCLVENLDEGIGQICRRFIEKNSNYLIIFCVDNGSPFNASNGGFRGVKHSLFEGGIRLPAIIHKPGMKHKITNGVFHAVDIYPTILSACGGSLDQELPIDGKDILKSRGHHTILLNANAKNQDGIRVGDHKLIVYKNNRKQIFNIANDPYEEHDLICNLRLLTKLEAKLHKFRKETVQYLETPR